MRYPQDAMSQRHLVGHLRELIDRVRRWEGDRTPEGIGRHAAAVALLDALLDLNPNAAASSHVLHNLGRARRTWLVQHQRVRAGASASSP